MLHSLRVKPLRDVASTHPLRCETRLPLRLVLNSWMQRAAQPCLHQRLTRCCSLLCQPRLNNIYRCESVRVKQRQQESRCLSIVEASNTPICGASGLATAPLLAVASCGSVKRRTQGTHFVLWNSDAQHDAGRSSGDRLRQGRSPVAQLPDRSDSETELLEEGGSGMHTL